MKAILRKHSVTTLLGNKECKKGLCGAVRPSLRAIWAIPCLQAKWCSFFIQLKHQIKKTSSQNLFRGIQCHRAKWHHTLCRPKGRLFEDKQFIFCVFCCDQNRLSRKKLWNERNGIHLFGNKSECNGDLVWAICELSQETFFVPQNGSGDCPTNKYVDSLHYPDFSKSKISISEKSIEYISQGLIFAQTH